MEGPILEAFNIINACILLRNSTLEQYPNHAYPLTPLHMIWQVYDFQIATDRRYHLYKPHHPKKIIWTMKIGIMSKKHIINTLTSRSVNLSQRARHPVLRFCSFRYAFVNDTFG